MKDLTLNYFNVPADQALAQGKPATGRGVCIGQGQLYMAGSLHTSALILLPSGVITERLVTHVAVADLLVVKELKEAKLNLAEATTNLAEATTSCNKVVTVTEAQKAVTAARAAVTSKTIAKERARKDL